jgi:hypothetical protein
MMQMFYIPSPAMATSPTSWLVLIHQLPPKPAYLRVKVWRRLQALGSVPIKNSVYVLPNTDEAREDFEWMLREITEAGGEASLCEARLVDGLTDAEVRASFQTARENDYRALAKDLRALAQETLPRRKRALTSEERAKLETALGRVRKHMDEIGKIDFFGAPGREAVEGLLGDLERRMSVPDELPPARSKATRRVEEVRGSVWVTRTGVHIDRMASAWLILRFIDPDGRFKFVPNRGYAKEPGELRFDMFDAEFTHEGDLCTFEMLLRRFDLRDPALIALGEVIHDVDLKESKFARPETPGVDHLVMGIAWTNADDEARLTEGATLFDALYGYYKRRKG